MKDLPLWKMQSYFCVRIQVAQRYLMLWYRRTLLCLWTTASNYLDLITSLECRQKMHTENVSNIICIFFVSEFQLKLRLFALKTLQPRCVSIKFVIINQVNCREFKKSITVLESISQSFLVCFQQGLHKF